MLRKIYNCMTLDLSSSLRMFLRCCCLIQEKKIVTDPSLILLKKFHIFAYFRLNLNITIYLTLLHRYVFSLVSSLLCFLLIFNTLFSVRFQLHWVLLLPFFSSSQALEEIKIFDLQNLINVHDMLGNFTVTCFYATFSYCSILRLFSIWI